MELRPYQQDCIATIEAQPPGSYLVQMATGLGKCFAPGTEILMFDGTIRRVEDIREGEQVMGADSTPRTVVGLAHGEEPMYRITPTKGEPYIVNESHILSLKITGLNGKNVTDSLGRKFSGHDICNISVQDYLKSSKTFKHCAKGWRVAVDYPERPVTIPPYILGIWLGDGASRGTSVTTMEPEIVHEMQRYAAKNKMRVCVCDSSNTGRATTYSFIGKGREHGCNTFRNELKSMGLFQNKHIPSDYLLNDRKNRMELLAGLLDTDGFLVDETVFEITTCQKILEKNILTLARSLGFAAYSAPKAVNGETYYRIDISGGDIANEILPYLDFAGIEKSGKQFWGYSDLTAVINAVYAKTGKSSVLYQVRNLIGTDAKNQIRRFSDTVLGGGKSLYLSGCNFLQKERMQGIVVGGNIRCLLKLAGTPFWPDMREKILLLEGFHGGVAQLQQMGVFAQINGLLLGTFTELEQKGYALFAAELAKQFAGADIPVARTGEIGHGADAKAIVIGRELILQGALC